EVARFSSFAQDGAEYLLVRYRPELKVEGTRQRRDWVFLVETSGNRDPLLARTQVEVVRALLNNAEAEDTFAVLTAGTRTRLLTRGLVAATPANMAEALAKLEGAHLIGALDLKRALASAGEVLKKGKAPYLVHLGTGVPAMGERRQDVLVGSLPKGTRYVGV